MSADLDAALAALELAGAQLGDARAREMELEDTRAILKVQVVQRVLAAGGIAGHEAKSATAAEKLVEFDDEYTALRARQRDAVIAVDARRGVYDAAKLRAQHAVHTLAAGYGV